MGYGMYRGKPEKNPGKMMYRHKGSFDVLEDAKKAQIRLKMQGKKTKIIKYTDDRYPGYSLYVLAPHDFWGKAFILKRRD